jgi:serine O-acetyltransferase
MNIKSKLKSIKKIIYKIYRKAIIYDILWKCDGDFWKIKCELDNLRNGYKKQNYLMAYNALMNMHGSMIGYKAQFEGRPFFPHGIIGIFISDGSKIDKNCTIFQHVTIGSNLLLDSKGIGAPSIKENCYIGAGAKIIGNVSIGKNCRIGANCVVYKNMPDNSVAVLQPTRLIQKSNLDNRSHLSLKDL